MPLQGQGPAEGTRFRKGDCPAPEGLGSSLLPHPRLSHWLQCPCWCQARRSLGPPSVFPDRREKGGTGGEAARLSLLQAGGA